MRCALQVGVDGKPSTSFPPGFLDRSDQVARSMETNSESVIAVTAEGWRIASAERDCTGGLECEGNHRVSTVGLRDWTFFSFFSLGSLGSLGSLAKLGGEEWKARPTSAAGADWPGKATAGREAKTEAERRVAPRVSDARANDRRPAIITARQEHTQEVQERPFREQNDPPQNTAAFCVRESTVTWSPGLFRADAIGCEGGGAVLGVAEGVEAVAWGARVVYTGGSTARRADLVRERTDLEGLETL